jgi:hypothetical protein
MRLYMLKTKLTNGNQIHEECARIRGLSHTVQGFLRNLDVPITLVLYLYAIGYVHNHAGRIAEGRNQ